MLSALEIRNIRVYEQANISPDPCLNLISGPNASGKTSLLEAIYLLGTGRSYRTKQLERLQRHGTDGFGVHARLVTNPKQDGVQIGFSYNTEGRRVNLNGLPQNQISTIAQLFPLQVISPDSHYDFRSNSRQRRGVLDWGLFHVEPDFSDLWTRYQRQLQQRNAALKSERQSSARHIWDEGLASMGEQVQTRRIWLLEQLKIDFLTCCHELLDSDQQADLILEPGWETNKGLAECLQQDLMRDVARGFTHSGPHRADLRIVLRDPIQRAEYLLAQEGLDVGEQRSKNVPPELLEEVFELNMLLEEAPDREELEQAKTKFQSMQSETDQELSSLFERYDTSGDAAVLQSIRGALNRRRYIQNLVRDVEKSLAQ